MAQLVAFLRGINLGKRTVKMDDLRRAFADMGLNNARTLIASGNVLFDAEPSPELIGKIEAGLLSAFGFEVDTIIRSIDELRQMQEHQPFKGRVAGKDCKFYVFFLAKPVAETLKLPENQPGDFEILSAKGGEVYAVAHRMASGRFGPGLDLLGKATGKAATNRNWNTILRLLEKAAS